MGHSFVGISKRRSKTVNSKTVCYILQYHMEGQFRSWPEPLPSAGDYLRTHISTNVFHLGTLIPQHLPTFFPLAVRER